LSLDFKRFLRLVVPLTAAMMVVTFEREFAQLVRSRPGVIPVLLVAMLGGMLLPQVRHWLIVGLCFGISALAVRDALRATDVPMAVQWPFIAAVYMSAWVLIALLAAGAGAVEALKPGSVWAKRCYFAAAAMYCAGRGILWFPSWESIVFLTTGGVSAIGIFLAPRTIWVEPKDEDQDARAHRERTAVRYAALAAREWKGDE